MNTQPLAMSQDLIEDILVRQMLVNYFPQYALLPKNDIEWCFVSPSGYDHQGGGRMNHPLKTIQKAIDLASETKHTFIFLQADISAADTIDKFDDDTVGASLANAYINVDKSFTHFIGIGGPGEVLINPGAAATAGIVSLPAGSTGISFNNITFVATTAANAIIKSVSTVSNIKFKDCILKTGTGATTIIGLDLDGGLATNVIVEDCEFHDMYSGITIAPVLGRISNCKIIVGTPGAGTAGIGITIANTSGTKGIIMEKVLINGGTAGGANNYTIGIHVVGSNTVGANIINCNIENCDADVTDAGTNTFKSNTLTADAANLLVACT